MQGYRLKKRDIIQILNGLKTYIPGGCRRLRSRGTGGTISTRYCYSVWLRHLVMLHNNGLSTTPDIIAELGPGSSLGTGLAAMLTGANKYWAFDVVPYADNKRNLEIFDQLVALYDKREKIPDALEFPRLQPLLDSYDFPSHILTEQRLKESLKTERLSSLRKAIINLGTEIDGLQVKYVISWDSAGHVSPNSIDMIFSQAVLEYVNDLSNVYNTMYRCLKHSGIMSHRIDFKCDGISETWNGHWRYRDFVWGLIKGNRSYWLNRFPCSVHVKFIEESGFKIICDVREIKSSQISKNELAPKFSCLTDGDLTTAGVFIQAIKK